MYLKIHPTKLAIAIGLVFGIGLCALTFVTVWSGYGIQALDLFYFYPGYDISTLGALLGFVWGFIDGFIGGYLVAWIYNKLLH